MSALAEAPAAEPCGWANPLACAGDVVGGVAGGVAGSAWEAVCRSFADAAVSLLEFFANGFVTIGSVDLQSPGVRDVYATSLGLAALVAVFLLLVQIARTAMTHEGSALAYGLVGLGKAALAFMVTLTVGGVALVAADEVTAFIVNRAFGSSEGLRDKLAGLFAVAPTTSPSLLLILAIVCILLVVVLWFELLLRNAALVALIATSPIAAAGQISETTKAWWPKLVGATIQLIVLKPVIALVFALGLNVTGGARDVATLLSGLVVLLLAALAWPAIARFFTFASVQMGGGMGLAGLLGAGSNAANARNGMPVGADPNQFSQTAEARTMGAHAGRAGGAAGTSSGGVGGASGGAAAGGAAAATGGAAVAVFAAKAVLDTAQKGANALVGKSEQMAGHAGLDRANPHANPAGYPRHAAPAWPARHGDPPPPPAHEPAHGDDDDPPPPVPPPTGSSPVQHQRAPQAQAVEQERERD
ncbi:hypothetical protein [Spirilliplanes yamanashiensis]|uniref:TrbL/VirB6 plasmid conjugal transfer protein n=1 Tax=Spirilliplanes yamanashiensis TaxID=42233 RepID=A0A8J3YER7_9ACTN|nr:hypothetical protein [Spirilliplanes yamanashiensis]MDP9818504.1 flagellar biosynthesis protein FliQ [Spirilliplanes yamanashiensis]GIJ06370.1 hypothetical protein Sya03_57220 [Spirilliplanes yamanashiensis]